MPSRRRRTALLSIAAIVALLPAAAGAWVVAQTSGEATAGVVDSAGDIYTVGESQGADFVVTKLAGDSGKRRWRSVLFPGSLRLPHCPRFRRARGRGRRERSDVRGREAGA